MTGYTILVIWKLHHLFVALAWVQDGIQDLEVKAIQELSYINYDDEELASSVINLAWVQDRIKDIEWVAIDWVNNFNGAEVATWQLSAFGWSYRMRLRS